MATKYGHEILANQLARISMVIEAEGAQPQSGCVSQPGVAVLRYPGYLGRHNAKPVVRHNPEGVAAHVVVTHDVTFLCCQLLKRKAATPSGLDPARTLSQGCRVRQPWASRRNPVGIGASGAIGVKLKAAGRVAIGPRLS
jgi:hypothetical protein